MTERLSDAVELHDPRPNRESVIERLRLYRERDDVSRWAAGDEAVRWLKGVAEGRRMEELASLAEASGYSYAGLRERHDCSDFWPPNTRIWTDGVIVWSHYNRARRGADPETACLRMEMADRESLTVAAFEKTLKLERSNAHTTPTLSDAIQTAVAVLVDLSERRDIPSPARVFVEQAVKALRLALGKLAGEAVN